MAPRLKQDYPALIAEYERRIAAGESLQEVKSAFTARGINFGTFDNQRRAFKKKTPTPQEPPMIEEPVDVLPGQVRIEDADTAPAEVHYGAVHEFDTLPDGYAKVIQPMRPYSDAEEWALNESMRLYGFIGAIVCDQFGRVLDGNQRQRIARLRGLSVPHTTPMSGTMRMQSKLPRLPMRSDGIIPRNNDRNLHHACAIRAFPIAPSLMR